VPARAPHTNPTTTPHPTLQDQAEETLLDYEEEEQDVQDKAAAGADAEGKDSKKGHYVGVHSSGFRDFMLKPELLRAVVDCGFEHPSEGAHIRDGRRASSRGQHRGRAAWTLAARRKAEA
jgi:hypothetical protein